MICRECEEYRKRKGIRTRPNDHASDVIGTKYGTEKICNKCLTTKALDKFYISNNCRFGTRNICIQCLANEFTSKSIDQIEERKKRNRDRYQKDIVRRREKGKIEQHKRRSLLKESYSTKDWELLKRLANYKCLACDKEIKLTVDHIVPVTKNGINKIDNLQPLCLICNIRKMTKTIDFRSLEFKQKVQEYVGSTNSN